MKSQKIYPIGYLLKVLHISYTELANALFLDRTVVNKWALGVRSFNAKSLHYKKVVDYLVQINNQDGKYYLNEFFERIYPNIPKSQTYIRECINKFLSEPELISNVGGSVLGSSENVYYCTVPVQRGIFGRFASLLDLLDKTLISDEKCSIILYDSEQYYWLTEDEYYANQFKDIMIKVLEKGHEVIFISEVDYLKRYHHFVNLIEDFYTYSNFNEYFFISNKNPEMVYSYYLVKDIRVVIGNRLENNELYTMTLNDQYSLESWSMNFKNHLKCCKFHEIVRNDNERLELFKLIRNIARTGDKTYIFTVGLSFITMSRELLNDVLKSNNVCCEKREQVLALLDNHEAYVYNKHIGENTFRQMCFYNDIEQMLLVNKWSIEELSLHLGEKIYLSRSQVIRHIYDTANLLERNINFRLGLLREIKLRNRTGYALLCRRNQYVITCKGEMRVTREVNIINEISDLMNHEWNSNIPFEYLDNEMVAEKLRLLAKKYEFKSLT